MEGRRLPTWMSAPPVKRETSSSSTASVSCGKDNAAVSTQDKEAETKELKVNQLPGNEGQKKRGKRKLHDAVTIKREKASEDVAPTKTRGTRRRRKESHPSPSCDDESEIACNTDIGNEDDVELTEEDLLSIANEYIAAAAAAAANEDSKNFSGKPKKKKLDGSSSSEFSPTKEASVAAFGLEKSSDEKKSVVVSSSSSTTGCEDMLNLLLGNLLTKNVT